MRWGRHAGSGGGGPLRRGSPLRRAWTALTAVAALVVQAGLAAAAGVELAAPTQVTRGQRVEVALSVSELSPVYGAEVYLRFDPAVVRYVQGSARAAGWPEGDAFLVGPHVDGDRLSWGATLLGQHRGITLRGTFLRLQFEAVADGNPGFRIERYRFADPSGRDLAAGGSAPAPPAGSGGAGAVGGGGGQGGTAGGAAGGGGETGGPAAPPGGAGSAADAGRGGPAFRDVRGHWAAADIRRLAAQGLLSGYPDGTFRPSAPVTRAELARLLRRLFQALGGEGAPSGLAAAAAPRDVAPGHWAAADIAWAQQQGLLQGYAGATFRPGAALTREELAAVLARLADRLGVRPAPATTEAASFSDVPAGRWSAGAIRRVAGLGWMRGYPDGTFGPARTVTRAEMAAILSRLLGQVREGR